MFSITLGNIVFFILGFTWTVYLMQEIFISGVAILSSSITNNDEERKRLQVISGLHFDGMEVWLIAAIAIMEGAFPAAFGQTFSYLYVVMFLLLFAIIGRGVSVEVIYKLDNPTWQKSMRVMWIVSSVAMMFLLGVYIANTFLGFPFDVNGLNGSQFSILNVTGISGGLLFVSLSIVSGAGWISLSLDGNLKHRAMHFVKKTGVYVAVPVLLLLTFMGLNNIDSPLWVGTLYISYPVLYIFPILAVIMALLVIYFGYIKQPKELFIVSILTMVFFIISGYVGVFPHIIASNLDPSYGLLIEDAMSSTKGLTIVLVAVGVFYPIIITYQIWKYKTFFNTEKIETE